MTSGIVLIDEIDMHLHPKWQWNIINALQKVFPNVQFIEATHSPILFASAKDVWLFDAFYHYEMAENVIRFFKKKYPRCQIIMTSHNTNLMTNRLMRPDCMFILSRKGTLTALCNATTRELREGHNLEKMYISVEFEKYE